MFIYDLCGLCLFYDLWKLEYIFMHTFYCLVTTDCFVQLQHKYILNEVNIFQIGRKIINVKSKVETLYVEKKERDSA